MLMKAGKVAFIMGSTSICTLLSNVLIARTVNKADMGMFSLIVSLVMLFGSISLLGRSNALARYFSKHSLSEYNWRKELTQIFPMSLSVVLILALCSRYLYQLSIVYLLIITVSSMMFVYIQLISAGIIRSQGKFNLAMFSQKGYIFLFILLLLVLMKFNLSALDHFLFIYALSLLLFGLLNVALVSSTFASGTTMVPKEMRLESLLFWGINISLIAIRSLDKLIIVKLISYDGLAIYVTVLTITGLYELVSMSLGYVLLPHFGRAKAIHLTTHIVQGTILAAVISGVYLLWGKQIIHLIYSGKYDQGHPMMVFFILAGICKVLYAIPSSVIGGRLEKKALRLTFYYNATNVVLHVFFLFWFIAAWGLKGAALATFCIWFFRTVQGYFILYRNRGDLRPSQEVVEIYRSIPLAAEKLISPS